MRRTAHDRYSDTGLPHLIVENMSLFACPECGGQLGPLVDSPAMECTVCHRRFESEDGICQLFWPNDWDSTTDVTEVVRAFYEENPFPDYEDLDSVGSLREKAQQAVFAQLLDQQLPLTAKILEVGCGTGQFSNFLGSKYGRTVFGTDLCLNSLRLGEAFRRENEISNVAFVQMNLFRPVFKPEVFDVVVCNGVLHHTSDPLLGFQTISKLVKRGGLIVIGLYNRFGRIPTDIRRLVFGLSGGRFKFLDGRLRNKRIGDVRKHTYFMDQYKHPHESKHTYGEVLKWFDGTDFGFVSSIPKATAFDSFEVNEQLFHAHPPGTRLDHFMVQAGMLLSGGREGGFFMLIARRSG